MPRIYFVVLFFFLCSCNSKKNIDSAGWEILDSARGINYRITEKGKGDHGDLSIKFLGKISDNDLASDSTTGSQFIGEESIVPCLVENTGIKQLPKGTTGFIRIDPEKFFQENYAEIRHYTLYFNSSIADNTLKEDSVKLVQMGVFKKIDITNAEQALEKFSEDNDTTWRSFIKSNPLPSSIELTLKKEFLTGEKYDSIKNILLRSFEEATEIQLPSTNGLLGLNNELKKDLVYKFVIF